MNILSYKKNLKPLSRDLRKKQTSAEQILWQYLRKKQILNVRFTRQKPIGPYIVDFYSKEKRLVIELDGIDHYSDKGKIKDHKRDEYLTSLGLTVPISAPSKGHLDFRVFLALSPAPLYSSRSPVTNRTG
jgi:very-short-patch-repair endonuclease